MSRNTSVTIIFVAYITFLALAIIFGQGQP